MNEAEQIREAKRLVVLASNVARDPNVSIGDLILALKILIDLMEGHRHAYYQPGMCDPYMTRPIRVMES